MKNTENATHAIEFEIVFKIEIMEWIVVECLITSELKDS